MEAGLGVQTAHLDRLDFPDHRVPIDDLRQPEDAIGHREEGVVARLVRGVLAHEERGRLAARQVQREALEKRLEIDLAGTRGPQHRLREAAERIHDHERRIPPLDLPDDGFQRLVEAIEDLLIQVHEVDAPIHFRWIEEGELLLIAQHLERRLSDDREIQGGSFR